MKTVLFVLVLGLAGGGAAGYFGRPAIERAVGGVGEVEGVVVAERRENDRLVLTLRSGDETILASFRERADDVADLVAEGDTLTVRVGARGVFADDVPIVRLRRAVDGVTEELDEDTAHASADEPRGRRHRGAHGSDEAADANEADAAEGEAHAEADPEADAPEGEADAEEGDPEETDAEEAETGAEPAEVAAEEGDEEAPAVATVRNEAELAAEIHRRARARRHRRRAAAARARAAHEEEPASTEAPETVEAVEAVAPPPVAEAETVPSAASES